VSVMMPRPGFVGTVGILGSGQLGKMLLPIAHRWSLQVATMDPSPHAPAAALSHRFVVGDLNDRQAVLDFGRSVDLLTYEIESVDVEALQILADEGRIVRPAPSILRVIQDKRRQKQFFVDQGLPTLPFTLIDDASTLAHAEPPPTLPMVFKLGQGGYDGRGVWLIREAAQLEALPAAGGIIEPLLSGMTEISVIVARSSSGEVVTYPATEMVFHPTANLVETLLSPARLPRKIAARCREVALSAAEALGLVGLLAVEMFVDGDGKVFINECSPRPHNSGHHTIEANPCSQYEQMLRAILDLPLGAVSPVRPAAMVNLLGEEGARGPAVYPGVERAFALPGVSVHLYGKTETRPFRKMGHVTAVADSVEQARALAMQARGLIRVTTPENV
jgi:5-(carboxyamino)imidazole ribonucleotide synthase